MGIVNLTTNLKSLRFGKDRVGGGSSNQPYVKSSIDQSPGDTGGPDFLLRANTLKRIGNDESRIIKFLADEGKGIRFTAKQNLLSKIGVKTQASGLINEGAYLPTSTLAQLAANPFGGHLNKQGLNPLANTKTVGSSTGSSILDAALNFNPLGIPAYLKIEKEVKDISTNRLLRLKESKISVSNDEDDFGGIFGKNLLGLVNPFNTSIKDITNTLFTNKNEISPYKNEILRYGGGPGSVLGVGQTKIGRYSSTLTKGSSLKDHYFTLDAGEGSPIKNSGTTTVKDFREKIFKKNSLDGLNRQGALSLSVDYRTKNIENRVNLGNPGKRNKNVLNYQKGLGEALDKLNALEIYKSSGVTTDTIKNDLIKFRIGVIDNTDPSQKTYIHFRAFIDSFEDNYSAEWAAEKYMGRGENLYRYKGFDRNISLSWTVAAQSKEELIPMYKKLNYLASTLTPDYSGVGYMRGNLVTLTMGGYCYEQPGIITSLNYTVPEESPWEIALPLPQSEDFNSNQEIPTDSSVKELPHIIKVTGFNFIPIHNFVPRVQQNNFESGVSYGAERYIALNSDDANNEYDKKVNDTQTNFDESEDVFDILGTFRF